MLCENTGKRTDMTWRDKSRRMPAILVICGSVDRTPSKQALARASQILHIPLLRSLRLMTMRTPVTDLRFLTGGISV